MKKIGNYLTLTLAISMLQLTVLAQSTADTVMIIERCISISDLQPYLNADQDGEPAQVVLVAYPLSFGSDFALTYQSKPVRIASREDIRSMNFLTYFNIRSLVITGNTAKVSMNLFYEKDPINGRYRVSIVNASLSYKDGVWDLGEVNLK